jgi:exopolyphosphatase/guanosine-5'-triphosphate,3'-diphosphate pyrophosphatase
MELTRIDGLDFGQHVSVPLGPLRLIDETRGNRQAMQKLIAKHLEDVSWLGEKKTPHFYAIGGTFRSLAKMHLTAVSYPLRILHEYTVEAKAFGKFVDDLLAMDESKLAAVPGLAAKRVDAIVPGVLVIKHILARAKPEEIVFCAAGIREGYLYEKLSPHQRKQDPLLASAGDLVNQSGRLPHYGQELFVWMAPLFAKEDDQQRRLRLAVCMLSEIAWAIHPEYRAEWAMHRVLQSSLTGITHQERVQLALALYHRHQSRMREPWPAISLLSAKAQHWSRAVGMAAGLAYTLSGSIPGSLHRTALSVEKDAIKLTASAGVRDLQGDLVRKRLDGLNDVYKHL